ncbi:AraC family transcriptional regulator [Pseudomonas sp. GM17]|uniref:AraC family transcriptional regulator n=1 Tax=Pseudomonas sp. GM17 TaxID=1144323 RepID=UPI000272506A|nr:AraC family transcriptional regulator [Pseudomonas sp. GM17]WIE48440.1 AraC family transcriptional regulator ligand-binding domain-containing protein [Pseudomonas sp. GM17]
MSNPTPVVFASIFVSSLLAAARERGYEIEGFLRDAGIDPQQPQDLEHHVTVDQYVTLLRKTIKGLDDEGVALFSRKLRRGSFLLMMRSALTGNTLAAALHEFTHTLRLLQDDLNPLLVDDGRHLRVELHFISEQVRSRQFAHVLLLRLLWRVMAWLEGGNLRPVGIDLAFAQSESIGSYRKLFPTVLRFGMPCSTICFDSVALQAPVRRDSSHLDDYLDKALLDLLVPAIPTRVSDRVRAYLREERARHSIWPDLEQTSTALHCSASSLQRHLSQEGSSFQNIRESLRRDWATYRLKTSTLSTPALAEELGFADSASFQRAFKRWTGLTPGQVRKGC